MAKYSILHPDNSFIAQALVFCLFHLYKKHSEGILNKGVQLKDIVSTIELLVSDLKECSRLLSNSPQFQRQQVHLTNIFTMGLHDSVCGYISVCLAIFS